MNPKRVAYNKEMEDYHKKKEEVKEEEVKEEEVKEEEVKMVVVEKD